MRALLLRGRELSVADLPRPQPGPGQVLARVRACGICGSDLHAALYLEDVVRASRETGGAWDERVLTDGVVMGHEFVAEVVEPGPGAEGWKPGTRVTSIPALIDPTAPRGVRAIGYSPGIPGGYAEYLLLSAPLLLRVPDELPDDVAAMTEPCAVGLHAVRRGQPEAGQPAFVMGAGPIGLMVLLWLKRYRAKPIIVSELSRRRRELAAALGADVVVDPRETDLQEVVGEGGSTPCSLLFECVGVEGTLAQAMQLAPRGARIVVAGACMTEDRIRPLVGIGKELTIQFVLGYTPEEFAETLGALASGDVDPRPMVTRTVSLEELPATFTALASPEEGKVLVVP